MAKVKNHFFRILAIFCFLVASLVGIYIYLQWEKFNSLDEPNKLQIFWKRDLENLAENNKLPKQWADIQFVQFIPGTEPAKKWIKALKPPMLTHKKGEHHLEVLVLDITENDYKAAVLQMDLIHTKKNKLIWQLGRTYPLKGSLPQ